MTKKMGPLPVWAWGVIFGVAVYFLYERSKANSSSSSTTSPTATVLDPNAIDPATGQTYGSELGSTAGTAPASGSLGSSTPTDTGSQLSSFDGDLMTFLQAQQDLGQVAGALGFTPPNTTPGLVTGTGSGLGYLNPNDPTVKELLSGLKASKPTTKPKTNGKKPPVHTKPKPAPKPHTTKKPPAQHPTKSPSTTAGHQGAGGKTSGTPAKHPPSKPAPPKPKPKRPNPIQRAQQRARVF